MELQHIKPLPKFAFNFNVRRFTWDAATRGLDVEKVGWCKLDETRVESA